jgi:membrane protease YdiL (CAAX protease family)
MSSTEIATPPPLPVVRRPPRTWYFLGSTIAVLIAYATLNLAHMIVIIALVVQHGDPSISPSKLQELAKGGPTTAAGAIFACPLVLAVLWVTIRIARRRFAEYLALRLPSRAELLRGLAISLAFLLAWDLLTYLTGQAVPAFVIDSYRTARDAGQLWLLLVGYCIAAPITEEFAVRGFLFRGWSQSFLGPLGAIVASSAVWAIIHFQYDWYFVGEVFCVGLIFGYLRYRSHSTWLAVAAHAFFNLAVMAQTALFVAYFL